ncbi:redoxin domain-containing protein [Chitinophagaceae bacterium 26-R-25]|nr:redoxin domain-containing protein [Chitinophagaceae bacterium 26-R-25]
MKKISFLLLMVVFMGKLFAQSDSLPAYKRFPNIPPFTLVGIDSAKVTRDDIPKHKKVMLMYFSPECEHCQHQTQDILGAMNGFKDVEIVMMTYQPYEEMVDFYKKYELAKYPNIKIGRDTKFFFPPFYRMQSLPYLALYDKKGNLITTFEGNRKPDKLLKAFDNKLD